MATLPVCFRSRLKVVTQAAVDDDLYELLRTRDWYLSSFDKPAPPKFSRDLPIEGGGIKLSHFQLNRVVQGLILCEPEEQFILWNDLSKLWNYLTEIPRVKFVNGNPFDCRRANLSIAMKPESLRRKDRELRPFLLPIPPHVPMPAEPQNTELEVFGEPPTAAGYDRPLYRVDDSEKAAQEFLDFLGESDGKPSGSPGLSIRDLPPSKPPIPIEPAVAEDYLPDDPDGEPQPSEEQDDLS
jgi:hypothetical protein